jgi:hypothetical protein
MGNGGRTSDGQGRSRSFVDLIVIAGTGALIAWLLAPSGAAGQQNPLPAPPPPPQSPAPPPPPTEGSSLPLMTPFPIVRIVARTIGRGATITRLTVRASTGSDVISRCVGPEGRCPYRQRTTRISGEGDRVRTVHVRGFERTFRAGVLLRIYVASAGRIGKFTSFKIRSNRAPRRNDGCVADIVLRPVPCPSG